ncbi:MULTISPECIES: hypothetical protein [Brevundimonas]|uniref:hypothetical protein n=1 Tax=Brevundimonas TaxID=41275 RepID=UPI001907EEF2|nr:MULTISPECIES: hypothetical protein [Brevundimonas]MBK1969823.1 hypothetical protein [Brevundimonas diminuta]
MSQTQTSTAAEQYQTLVTQEAGLLTAKARLLEQLETTNAQLTAIRAALQGAQLGFNVAQEAVDKPAPTEPDAAPVEE